MFGMEEEKEMVFEVEWNEVKKEVSEGEGKYVEKVEMKDEVKKWGGGGRDEEKGERVNNWKL